MNYPAQLLPNRHYKIIECDINHLHLVRHIELKGEDEIIDPDTGNVKLKYVADPTRHIADYSTNLLGIFELKHIAIYLTADGKKLYNTYCLPDAEVKPLIYNTDFQITNNRKYFTIKIADISNIPVPFVINGIEKKAKCLIEHTPMKWNFWHFSIRWINDNSEYLHDQNENLFDRPKQGWVRLLSTAARAMLVHYADTNEIDYQVISKSCYTKYNVNPLCQGIYLFLKLISEINSRKN